jgi:aldose 1-epimerase
VTGPDPGLVELANGRLRVVVQPGLGAGLTQMATWHGGGWQPLMRSLPGPAQDPEQLACCVLVPWSNRLYGGGFRWRDRAVSLGSMWPGDRLPLHGHAWLAPWQVVAGAPDELVLTHAHELSGGFAYAARLRYRLEGACLRVELGVEHRGPSPLPYGLGLHPWFVRDPDTEVAFRSTGRWEPDARHAPRHFRPLGSEQPLSFDAGRPLPPQLIDHVYAGWDGEAEICWPERGLALRMRADERARNLVVYSPPPQAHRTGFVCLEPVTHRNDAHRAPDPLAEGLVELRCGERLSLAVTLEAVAA